MSSVILPLADVYSAIRPFEPTVSIHFIVQKISSVACAIDPLVNASAIHHIIEELSFKLRSIWPVKAPLSVFLALLIRSFEHSLIHKDFTTFTILYSVLEVPRVG